MSEKSDEQGNEVPDVQVKFVYCTESCLGLTVRHGHYVFTVDGVVMEGAEWPLSPPVPSKYAGNYLVSSQAPAEDEDLKWFNELRDKLCGAIKGADLPETSEQDDVLIRRIDAETVALKRSPVADVPAFISEEPADKPCNHVRFKYLIEHGVCVIARKGCAECRSSGLAFYVDGDFFAHNNNVSTIEQAEAVVNEVLVVFALLGFASDMDVVALRAKIPELFPENRTPESR